MVVFIDYYKYLFITLIITFMHQAIYHFKVSILNLRILYNIIFNKKNIYFKNHIS